MNDFELIEAGREHPEYYFGAITDYQDNGWIQTFGRHRDSDTLDDSNFESILKNLEEKFEKNDDFRVEGSSHWAVGWTDTLMVRALQCKCEDWDDAEIIGYKADEIWRCRTCGDEFGTEGIRPIFYEIMEYKAALEEYPVFDEEDWSRREHEELMEYLEDEINSIVRRKEGDEIEEDFEPDHDEVFEYLFREHSVSCVEDLRNEWIEDAVLTVAEKAGKKL